MQGVFRKIYSSIPWFGAWHYILRLTGLRLDRGERERACGRHAIDQLDGGEKNKEGGSSVHGVGIGIGIGIYFLGRVHLERTFVGKRYVCLDLIRRGKSEEEDMGPNC